MQTIKKLCSLFGCAVLGGILGWLIGAFTAPDTTSVTMKELPLPHQVPKQPDGLSLRFAMVHDVLVERYPRHGKAWYRQRNERVRNRLDEIKTNNDDDSLPPEAFDLYDDLGVGLSRVGRHEKAVEVLREKRKHQKQKGWTGREMYTTYANLGTILIHGHMEQALAGSTSARDAVRNGLSYIRKAIEVNPGAHFGRERWQAVAVAFLLAAMEQPDLLTRYDMVGNPLRKDLSVQRPDTTTDRQAYSRKFQYESVDALLEPENEEERKQIRSFIRRIHPHPEWRKATGVDLPEELPFSEPVLGIVGMWRIGGGPNPHFALALGEIMLRVGQRRIAWEAYERAIRMKNRFTPDPELRSRLVEHCRNRQNTIENSLPDTDGRDLRSRFEAELQHALDWRNKYQAFERQRLNNGHDLKDPDFHEPFFEEHGKIATTPESADRLTVKRTHQDLLFERVIWPISFALFFAGLFGFLAGLTVYRRSGR